MPVALPIERMSRFVLSFLFFSIRTHVNQRFGLINVFWSPLSPLSFCICLLSHVVFLDCICSKKSITDQSVYSMMYSTVKQSLPSVTIMCADDAGVGTAGAMVGVRAVRYLIGSGPCVLLLLHNRIMFRSVCAPFFPFCCSFR